MTKWMTAALSAAALAGCGGNGSPDPARIRVIHLSPDAPSVSVYADPNGAPVVTGLAFPEGTAYLEVDPGTYSFAVTPTASPNPGSPVLALGNIGLERGKSYTAIAYDEAAGIQGLAIEDDYDGLAAGSIRVRAIHTASAVGEVDIWSWPTTGAPTPLFTDVAFGEPTATADLPAGAYRIAVDTNDDQDPELFFQLPALAAGAVVNVFAVSEGADVFLIAQLPNGDTARIDPLGAAKLRVLHLSPTTPDVDVFVNGSAAPAVDALGYREVTEYLDLDPGVYDFDVKLDGQTSVALAVPDVNLDGGAIYTVVAWGSPAQALLIEESKTGLASTSFRVNVVHAAAGVGQVDVWNVPNTGSPSALLTDFDEGAMDELDLPAGAYTVGLDTDDDAVPNLVFALPSLSAGLFVNLFAVLDGSAVYLVAVTEAGDVLRIDPHNV